MAAIPYSRTSLASLLASCAALKGSRCEGFPEENPRMNIGVGAHPGQSYSAQA